jgi:hypothetical protein
MARPTSQKIYLKNSGVLNLDEWYSKEITEASYNELIELTKWINKIYGYHPFIIGGWAVYSYTKSLGSRDIDIVFPTKTSVEKVLMPYYTMRGYKQEGVFSKSFYIEVQTKKGIEKIMLDACSLSDTNILHENKDIEISWDLTQHYYQEWKLQKDAIMQVPQIELLLMYKIKALCDRRYDLQHMAMSPFNKSYINSKIWKDEHDIVSLSKSTIDKEKISRITKITNFTKYFQRELKRLKINFS